MKNDGRFLELGVPKILLSGSVPLGRKGAAVLLP